MTHRGSWHFCVVIIIDASLLHNHLDWSLIFRDNLDVTPYLDKLRFIL